MVSDSIASEYARLHGLSKPRSSQLEYTALIGTLVIVFAYLVSILGIQPHKILSLTYARIVYQSDDLIRRTGLGSRSRLLTATRRLFGIGPAPVPLSTTQELENNSCVATGSKFSTSIPIGLGNWDNSCYQNCIVQALAAVTTLPNFLQDSLNHAGRQKKGLPMHTTLLETINKLNDPEESKEFIWLPQSLKAMSSWQQQDAQEYYSKILDHLEKEATKIWLTSQSGYDSLDAATKPATIDDSGTPLGQCVTSPLTRNPLDGLTAQRVSCTACDFSEGLSLTPFNCLTVTLGDRWGQPATIEECLDNFTELESISGVQCAKCTLEATRLQMEKVKHNSTSPQLLQLIDGRLSNITKALEEEDFSESSLVQECHILKKDWTTTTKTKQLVIARPPAVLFLHVNRSIYDGYSGAQMKNTLPVEFDITLNLSEWCLHLGTACEGIDKQVTMRTPKSMLRSRNDDNAKANNAWLDYTLRAVIVHQGSHENGHYVCFRKSPHSQAASGVDVDSQASHSSQWWRISDESVTAVNEGYLLRQGGVFMLVYEAVHQNESRAANENECAPVEDIEGGVTAISSASESEDSADDANSATCASSTNELETPSGSMADDASETTSDETSCFEHTQMLSSQIFSAKSEQTASRSPPKSITTEYSMSADL